MWEMIAATIIWVSPPQAPYVSCVDGHIAKTLAECPAPVHKSPQQVPYGGGGGGGRGGLLGLGIGGIL